MIAVALGMQAVMADHIAVVAGEHHNGVFRQAEFVQPGEQAPQVAIHRVNRAVVETRPLLDLRRVRAQ